MGATPSSSAEKKTDGPTNSKRLLGSIMIDVYPIKITAEQSMELFGLFSNKRTLVWNDIIKRDSPLTFRKCVNAKIEIAKLYQMQKDLEEWIRFQKVCLDDCKDLELWCPNPFHHFQSNIGDLILKRHLISAELLIKGGVTFDSLWDRYGLTPELMAMIKYTPEQWAALGIQSKHMEQFNESQWYAVFGNMSRKELLIEISRNC